MDHGDLVVTGDPAVGVSGEDAPDTDHAEAVEFGGAECAHARPADHPEPARQQQQNFLVPDGGAKIEDAVDQDDGARRRRGEPQHVAGPRGRQADERCRQHDPGKTGPAKTTMRSRV